jgi:hypothetical protein
MDQALSIVGIACAATLRSPNLWNAAVIGRTRPAAKAIVNRRRRTVDRRAAAARHENMNDTAGDAPIVGSARSRLVLRQYHSSPNPDSA